jgi:RNA polymerase subunit RPABC4/transcription elongation factor Spt4
MTLCRYCKREVDEGIKTCPYCGIVNPTLKLKEVFIWIVIITIIMLMFGFFQ